MRFSFILLSISAAMMMITFYVDAGDIARLFSMLKHQGNPRGHRKTVSKITGIPEDELVPRSSDTDSSNSVHAI